MNRSPLARTLLAGVLVSVLAAGAVLADSPTVLKFSQSGSNITLRGRSTV